MKFQRIVANIMYMYLAKIVKQCFMVHIIKMMIIFLSLLIILMQKEYQFYKRSLEGIYNNNPKRLKDFLDEMAKESKFENLEKLLYLQMKRSLELIPDIIPILSVEYLDDATKRDLFDEQSPLGIYFVLH